VGDCFYSLENRLIDMVGFQLCYNPNKCAPDQDSNYGRIQPRGLSQLLGPWPGRIFVVSSLDTEHVVNLIPSIPDQAIG
jgi:hypothetical protein